MYTILPGGALVKYLVAVIVFVVLAFSCPSAAETFLVQKPDGPFVNLELPEKALIFFVLPTCNYCKMIQPILLDALNAVDVPLYIIGHGSRESVAAAIVPDLANMSLIYLATNQILIKFGVTSYPTLFGYKNGNIVMILSGYSNTLTKDMLITYIRIHLEIN